MQERQVAVQDDHVIAVDGRVGERVAPVEDQVDGHALPAQPLGQGGRQAFVIFGHQYPHIVLLVTATGLRRCAGHRGWRTCGDTRVTAAVTVLSPPGGYNCRDRTATA